MMISSKWVLSALMLSTVASLSGCGELVSGANYKPTVKYLASAPAGAAAETKASEGGTTDAATSGGTATLRGHVELSGSIAPLALLHGQGGDVKDAAVCAAVDVPDQTIVAKEGKLANVFIYLRKAPKATSSGAGEAAVFFDQKNCMFKPHAMVTRVGQTIKILNSDAVAHNTHTYGNKTTPFNSIVAPNDAVGVALTYKQAEQEPITVGCDIHPWMKAYHLPVDHPFAAVTGEDGTFEIKDLPVGKHEFKVWHEAGKLLEKALVVTIKAGDNDPLVIKVSPGQLGK